jgi:hypothetical protein
MSFVTVVLKTMLPAPMIAIFFMQLPPLPRRPFAPDREFGKA